MRYAIFADIHANLEALEAVLAAYKKESVDKYFCVGDVVGYAANPNECLEKFSEINPVCVAGNHDWASVGLLSLDYFNRYAKEAISWTVGNLKDKAVSFLKTLQLVYKNEDLTLVHGTLSSPQDFDYMIGNEIASRSFGLLETDVCFVGHTHTPGIFIQSKDQVRYAYTEKIVMAQGHKYIVNVGSVGQPRDSDYRASYCLYDTENREIIIKRVDYDKALARSKIIEAGLPRFLGDRLLVGH